MWIDLLPSLLQENLAIIGLLVVGFFVEKHYVSRLSIFSNSIALNLYANQLLQPGVLLTLYANIGIVFGGVGLLAYLLDEELGEYYYLLTYFFYSSLAVGLVLLFPHGTMGFVLALLLAGFGNLVLLDVLQEVAAPLR